MASFVADNLPWLMVLSLGILVFSGLPVAFVLAGVSLVFSVIGYLVGVLRPTDFGLIYYRLYGTLTDPDQGQYAAVPALIFMGAVFANAGIARDLLAGIDRLLPPIPGRLAIASTALAIVLAPTAGVVAASVSALALITLPAMLDQGYRKSFAAGTIAAAGTLGVGFPPGVLLFFVADSVKIQVAAVYLGMLGPLLVLLALYCAYQILAGPKKANFEAAIFKAPRQPLWRTLFDVVPGLALIAGIIASITFGWAALSESGSVGAMIALLLAGLRGSLSLELLRRSLRQTTMATGMVFLIFVGAIAFSIIFRLSGGIQQLVSLVERFHAGPGAILALIMLIVFILGFFIDWIEIVLITFPVFRPVLSALDFSAHVGPPSHANVWIAVLLALNLQVSFLTPPFGFALFLTRGSAPPSIRMADIYRGIVPYVLLHLLVMALVATVPLLATWLPDKSLDLSIQRGPAIHDL